MRRLAVATVVLLGSMAGMSGTAFAHAGATDDRPRLSAVTPKVPGLEVAIQALERISVKKTGTTASVIVLGYSGEPYLRLEDGKVFRNDRSPATYLNTSRNGGAVPPEASEDPAATPHWTRLSDNKDGVRWHDHRLHRMPSTDTPTPWQIDLLVDGKPVAITGIIAKDPRPSQLPWWLGGFAVAAGLVAFARLRSSRDALFGGLGILFLTTQVVGLGGGGLLPGLASVAALAAGALVWFRRQTVAAGAVGVLSTAAAWSEVANLRFAHLGVGTGDLLFRGGVVLSVCAGAAVAVIVVLDVARPGDATTARSAP